MAKDSETRSVAFEILEISEILALVLVMSCFAFAIGLIFATNAGNYWLDIFNDYSASINLLIIGVLQFVVVAWVRA